MPIVTSLGPEYTSLGPSDATPSMIATVSPWADVSSSDPVVAHLSRQVVSIEVAYAAFCGISNVILPPLFRAGTTPDAVAVSRYADVVSQSLSLGPYLQILAPFPMDDQKLPKEETVTFKLQSSAKHATEQSSEQPGSDPFSTWDAWNHVRIVCNYAAKLALGRTIKYTTFDFNPALESC